MRGTVGIPLPSHSIRLEGVPEMNYDPLAEPPKGEVCIKGLTIFKGYYKVILPLPATTPACECEDGSRWLLLHYVSQ